MATTISASLVKELRDQTGAGMMDCKRALEESDGDLESAQKLLREKGVAQAAKRSGRETTEGVVVFDITSESVAAMVAIGCETEPVSKNDEFKVFAYRALEAVKDDGVDAVEDLEDERVELVAKLGENIAVAGAVRYEGTEHELLTAYVHPPANKIGVLLTRRARPTSRTSSPSTSPGRRRSTSPADEVPEAEVNAEREILSNQEDVLEKPENVRGKMVEGRAREVVRGLRAFRPGLDPRHRPPRRPGAGGRRARGGRVRALRSVRVDACSRNPSQSSRGDAGIPARPPEALRRGAERRAVVRYRPGAHRVARKRDRRRPPGAASRSRSSSAAETSSAAWRARPRAWTGRLPTTRACSRASSTR